MARPSLNGQGARVYHKLNIQAKHISRWFYMNVIFDRKITGCPDFTLCIRNLPDSTGCANFHRMLFGWLRPSYKTFKRDTMLFFGNRKGNFVIGIEDAVREINCYLVKWSESALPSSQSCALYPLGYARSWGGGSKRVRQRQGRQIRYNQLAYCPLPQKLGS